MEQAVVRLVAVTKRFGSGATAVTALRGVNLELFAGELVVVLGPSGAGKSTLLHIIGGIDTPTEGQVFARDREITGLSDAGLTAYRRRHVGFVFQAYNLISGLTALENVILAAEVADDALDPATVLNRVGLGARTRHFPGQLSGGEQQRVAIARAVAKRPDLLLCDEPTGALDAPTGKVVLRLLRELSCETGCCVVIITHNSVIARMADRVITMAGGSIEQIYRNESPADPADLEW